MTQYTQPTVKTEDLRLPGLDGMLPGAKVKGRNKVALDHLMGIGNDIAKEYVVEFNQMLDESHRACKDEYYDSLHKKIYARLKNNLLKEVQFDETDLCDFIYLNLDRKSDYLEQVIFGIYSGCLLTLLTERNREQNKRTKIYVNGEGKRFSYLFHSAKDVDELIVNSFRGESICDLVASYGGKANVIAIVNCFDYSDGTNNVASYGGKVGLVLSANSQISDLARKAGSNKGNVGSLISVNDYSSAAYGVAVDDGRVGLIAISNCRGSSAQGVADGSGKAGLIFLLDCDAFDIAYRTGFGDGEVGKVVLQGLAGLPKDVSASYFSDQIKAQELIVNSPEEYQEISDEFRLGEIFDLAGSISHDSTEQDIKYVVEQISLINKSIKPKVEALVPK